MCFELTVHRVGAFAGLSSAAREAMTAAAPEADAGEVAPDEAQCEFVLKLLAVARAIEDDPLFSSAFAAAANAAWTVPEDEQQKTSEVVLDAGDDKGHEATKKFVARLPARSMKAGSMDGPYEVRLRMSFTLCPFRHGRQEQLAKLWITIERIKPAGDETPDEANKRIADFITQADVMGDAAMLVLHKACNAALKKVFEVDEALLLRPNRMRVSFTDNDHENVDALLDAVALDAREISEIEKTTSRPADGLKEFKVFVTHVAGGAVTGASLTIDDNSVWLNETVPWVTAIYYQSNPEDQITTLIAGFARRHGIRRGERRFDMPAVDTVRIRSGALPVSARVVSAVASRLETEIVGRSAG